MRNLLSSLARIDSQNEYIIFINPDQTPVVAQENFRFVPLTLAVPLYSLREQYWLPIAIRRQHPDVMHYPNFNLPLLQSCPYIVTIHDLIYYLYPEQCSSRIAHYYACFMLNYAAKHARTLITVSEHSKQDLITYFRVPAEKIQVIFEAADVNCGITPSAPETHSDTSFAIRNSQFAIRNSQMPILKKYGIALPYILYVGKHHPYKNIHTLLRAYAIHPEVYENFQLVIAGNRDSRRKELYALAEKLDPGNKILFTDFIGEAELFDLYRGARLFVFPSLYEGFGLPPLEAMACGVPVITSNAASLPEVVGDAAIQVNPLNVQELADAMRAVLTDETLWNSLRARGLARSQQFSWDTAASQLLDMYQRAVQTLQHS